MSIIPQDIHLWLLIWDATLSYGVLKRIFLIIVLVLIEELISEISWTHELFWVFIILIIRGDCSPNRISTG